MYLRSSTALMSLSLDAQRLICSSKGIRSSTPAATFPRFSPAEVDQASSVADAACAFSLQQLASTLDVDLASGVALFDWSAQWCSQTDCFPRSDHWYIHCRSIGQDPSPCCHGSTAAAFYIQMHTSAGRQVLSRPLRTDAINCTAAVPCGAAMCASQQQCTRAEALQP
jgi:hypothetical protein